MIKKLRHKWTDKKYQYKPNPKFCTFARCSVCGCTKHYDSAYGIHYWYYFDKEGNPLTNSAWDKTPECKND